MKQPVNEGDLAALDWFSPFSQPVRTKPALPAASQQSITVHARLAPPVWKPSSADWKPMATVTITELPPTEDQIIELMEDPAQRPWLARITVKYIADRLEVAENRRRAVKDVNERNRQSLQQRKSIAFKIADRLRQRNPELRSRRKISALARGIKAEWRPREEAPALRTLRHWLTENK